MSVLVYFCCCNKLPHMYAVAQNNTSLLSCSSEIQKSKTGPMRRKSRSQQSCSLSVGSRENLFLVFFQKSFWPHHKACGILVPWPGIKLRSPVLESWSLNHWTTREVPASFLLQFPEATWILQSLWPLLPSSYLFSLTLPFRRTFMISFMAHLENPE